MKISPIQNDPVFALVEKQFPQALQPHMVPYETLVSEGSTGAGNVTAAPWIAVFDRRLTTSATYQQSAILSYAPYRIGALPEEAQLVADLQELTRLYTEIVSDPLEVTVERLVEAVVEPAPRVEKIEVRDFKPRMLASNRGSGGPSNQKSRRRYSPESRKVGDAGEKVVLGYERERLGELGRHDLAERVRWHAQELEFIGWDITSFDEQGDEIFVEVKSSAGKSVSRVDLTVNEWRTACDAKRRDRYYIYIVTDALSAAPSIERLRNPASYVDDRKLLCEAIVYELRLTQTQGGEECYWICSPSIELKEAHKLQPTIPPQWELSAPKPLHSRAPPRAAPRARGRGFGHRQRRKKW